MGLGGLAGWNRNEITLCCAAGDVTGWADVGGLVGSNISDENHFGSSIWSCYANGSVTGDVYIGSLVGTITGGSVRGSYGTGLVTGNAVGGLIGRYVFESGPYYGIYIEYCYYDRNTTGQDDDELAEGRTTHEMTYPYAENIYVDWDFEDDWAADTDYTINNGYPYLRGCVLPDEGEGEGEGEGEFPEGEPTEGELLEGELPEGETPVEGEGEPEGEIEGEGEGEGEPLTYHPADSNLDSRMVLGEAITYLAGWQGGSNPIAYAIRAAYLWQNGERYIYAGEHEPPLCWELAP